MIWAAFWATFLQTHLVTLHGRRSTKFDASRLAIGLTFRHSQSHFSIGFGSPRKGLSFDKFLYKAVFSKFKGRISQLLNRYLEIFCVISAVIRVEKVPQVRSYLTRAETQVRTDLIFKSKNC
jgi:hypothetical protein